MSEEKAYKILAKQKNISNNETKFELIRTGGAFKPFLTDIINDAVKRTALAILNS